MNSTQTNAEVCLSIYQFSYLSFFYLNLKPRFVKCRDIQFSQPVQRERAPQVGQLGQLAVGQLAVGQLAAGQLGKGQLGEGKLLRGDIIGQFLKD